MNRAFTDIWLLKGSAKKKDDGQLEFDRQFFAYLYCLFQVQFKIRAGAVYELLQELSESCPSRRTLHRTKDVLNKRIKKSPINVSTKGLLSRRTAPTKDYKIRSEDSSLDVKCIIRGREQRHNSWMVSIQVLSLIVCSMAIH